MSKFKRVTSGLVGVAMAASMFTSMPFSAFAEDEAETNNQTYVYDDYEVSYQVTNSWGDTEVVSITLSNTGDSTIEDWMLYFDPNGEVQYTTDCQQLTTSDGISYFKNSGYNADVAPDSSVTFGYAVNDCEAVPESFTLCQKRGTKTDGYTVSLNVNQSWGDSFSGEIVIQNNTDTAIEAWELTIDTNFTITEITNSWAATVTELEPYSYLLKGTYTGTVAANSSVSLGFIGVKDGEPEISSYSLTEVQVDADYVTLLHCYEDWENLPDTDGDGLPDLYEQLIGTDAAVADTDQDQLPDGYEVKTLNSDPTNANSLDVTQNDGAYDSDKDGLSNYEEYTLGTDPLTADSDHDGLSDGDEVNTYGTDPLKSDTDGDGLSDGDEIALGLNPLVVDTNGDGIPDNEEKFSQSKTFDAADEDTVVQKIDVAFEGTGYINSNTTVESVMDTDWMCSNVVGLIGEPYDISSDSTITEGTITFHVDAEALGESSFDDLTVLWYNEEEQRFEEMETTRNSENSTLSIAITHFSKYLIVDCEKWYAAWKENYYPESDVDLHTAITIDCSSSMSWNDPDRCRVDAAKGFVNVMADNDLASVTLFASNVNDKQSLSTLTKDKELLKETIDNVTSIGTTNYEEALQYSINSLDVDNNTSSENIIIFLSDGYPTNDSGYNIDPDDFDYSIINEAKAAGIKIYTIGLTDNVCETILEEMAERTGGEYFYANTAKELVPYFLNINVTEKYDTETDIDNDGIPDLFEIYGMPVANGQVLFSDTESKDTNNDGTLDSNPKDSDGDGLKDSEEVNVMYVNDDTDAKLAAEYVSEYYPNIEVNACGGIYFKMNSDPKNDDTDGDLDFDNADPDPLNYQLNGYFAQKMGELQKAAQEYLENSYTSSENDDYYGRKDIWLAFTFLRCFNSDYNWNHSNWNNAAGTLSESEFNSFKNFLNSSYESVYKYFVNTTEINAGDLGEHIDLYHMCATLSAYSYNSFAKVLVDKEYIDNLCGWAGDFQTLMNSAYNKTYNTNQYTTIYDAFYNQMGRSDDYFSKDDLYADVASLGVNDIFLVSRNESLRDVFNSYFIYSSTSAYVKDIATVLSLSDMQTFTEKFTFSFFITKKIDQYDSSYNISDSDIQNGLSAFVAYLYDNYDCKIKQMPLEELNHMNKIEKRFKSFLASVCVFAFLCFGSTSVVALESSGSIKNIGWSISSDTLLLEDENGNWNAIFEGNICTVNGLILSASCVTFEELFSEENGDLFEWLSEHPIDTLSINVEVLDSIASEDHLIGNVDTLIIGKNVQSIRNDSFLDVKYLKNVYIYSSNIDLTNTGIGFSYEGELSDIVMYGYIGSTTETYANENGFTFIALDADPNTTTTTTDVIITTTDTTTVTTANSTETITETTTISNVESTVTTTETNFTTIGDMTTETVETTDSTSNTTTVANIVEVDETKALTDSSTTTELTFDIAKVDETAKAASTETSTNTTETTSTTTTTTDDTTLPQTGYSKWYHVVVILAACMTGTGAVMVIGSGALKRKQK